MIDKHRRRLNSIYRKDCIKNATKAELMMKEWFAANKIKVIHQKGFLLPFHRIVDFYIPKKKIIIEIDGGYHKDTILKDNFKDKRFLEERKMKTIRIKNEEVFNGSFTKKLYAYIRYTK